MALFEIIYQTLTSKVFVFVKLDLSINAHVQYTALLDIEWMDFTLCPLNMQFWHFFGIVQTAHMVLSHVGPSVLPQAGGGAVGGLRT